MMHEIAIESRIIMSHRCLYILTIRNMNRLKVLIRLRIMLSHIINQMLILILQPRYLIESSIGRLSLYLFLILKPTQFLIQLIILHILHILITAYTC
jgi:hypothetical protein